MCIFISIYGQYYGRFIGHMLASLPLKAPAHPRAADNNTATDRSVLSSMTVTRWDLEGSLARVTHVLDLDPVAVSRRLNQRPAPGLESPYPRARADRRRRPGRPRPVGRAETRPAIPVSGDCALEGVRGQVLRAIAGRPARRPAQPRR